MRGASAYESLFATLATRREGAFVPFVMLGDPDPATSLEILRALVRGGADALELGIPFSDPVADGPVIQAAAVRALARGVTPAHCWRILESFRRETHDLPVGLLVYANLVIHRDPARFFGAAAAAGVDSVLVADAPVPEVPPLREAARTTGIASILIAPPNAPDARLREIARLSEGYVYVVSRPGVTGADDVLRADSRRLLETLRAHHAPPPLLGFGISRPEHVRTALELGAAGAISGSAVVGRIADHLDSTTTMLSELETFTAGMKAATTLRTGSGAGSGA